MDSRKVDCLMSTPTLSQAQKILALVPKGVTNVQVQGLIENGDLLRALFTGPDLSKVDRSAFMALLAPSPKSIDWTPVTMYEDKLRDWNDRFDLGLSADQIEEFHLRVPDHTGPHQPTGISLTLGRGLKGDREVIQQIIRYELGMPGVAYTDYIRESGLSVKYLAGSEPPKRRTPELDVALLDIGTFWDPRNGVVPNQVRRQRNRWPGLEVDWLMALNPQVLAAIDYDTVPGFIATGLVVDSGHVPVFDRDDREVYVRSGRGGNGFYGYSLVAFRGVL